jgi:hypothetical protein
MRDAYLAEDAAGTLNEARTRVLSVAAVSARALHIDHPPFLAAREAGHSRIHALIVGFGQTGQAIARDLIVNCRTSYLELPRITVIDPRAPALKEVLRVRAPEIDACAQFHFIEGEVGTDAMRPDPETFARDLGEGGPLTVAYVCVEADAEALTSAAMLQSLLRSTDIAGPPVYMRLRDTAAVTMDASGRGLDRLIPFGDLDAVLTASEFLSETPDAAARTFCAAYRAALPPQPGPGTSWTRPGARPTATPWPTFRRRWRAPAWIRRPGAGFAACRGSPPIRRCSATRWSASGSHGWSMSGGTPNGAWTAGAGRRSRPRTRFAACTRPGGLPQRRRAEAEVGLAGFRHLHPAFAAKRGRA